MPATVRKTGGRTELDAIWTLANALYTDLLGASGVRGKVVAIVTDLTTARTERAALATDVAALRGSLNTLTTKYNALLAKLDADAGVSDTNYAATQAGTAPPAVTSSAPAALTAVAPAAATADAVTLIGA